LGKKTAKTAKNKAKRGDFNGLLLYFNVRIGLTYYENNCSTRCELNPYLIKIKNKWPLGFFDFLAVEVVWKNSIKKKLHAAEHAP
jgi:hypothetical protein